MPIPKGASKNTVVHLPAKLIGSVSLLYQMLSNTGQSHTTTVLLLLQNLGLNSGSPPFLNKNIKHMVDLIQLLLWYWEDQISN